MIISIFNSNKKIVILLILAFPLFFHCGYFDSSKTSEDADEENVDESLRSVDVSKSQNNNNEGSSDDVVVHSSGTFIAFEEVGYETAGTASIVEVNNKSFVLLSDDFSTKNGPDLKIYLVNAIGEPSIKEIENGIEMELLKSIKGKQSYEIDSSADIEKYNTVVIYCKKYQHPWSYSVQK